MALAAYCHLSATVRRSPGLQQILQDSLDLVIHQVIRTEAGAIIFLLNERTGEMAAAVHRGVPDGHPCLGKKISGECLCTLAAQSGEMVFSRNGCGDERHRWPDMPPHQDLSMPLKARDRILGVMHLLLPPHIEITGGEHQLLRAVARQIGLTLDNALLVTEVQEQVEQLRGLTAQLAGAEEEARHRMARDLHDGVGQSLTILHLNLNLAQTLLPPGLEYKLRSCLAKSIALVHQTADMVRGLMADLRPPVLDEYGLLAALRWHGAKFAQRTGIAVNIEGGEPAPRLPLAVELALFRIAQEALTNVAKHAQASRVTITEEVEDGLVRLVIADNGEGFHLSSVGRVEDRPHWGLMTMRERATAAGGHCRIESRPGEGTRVVVEVPR